jgi:RimJ/RimL family protein N-acetyltransferase
MTESFPLNSNFAIVVEGKAIGGIGARFQDDVYKCSAELGYWVGEKYWRRGIATEAVNRMTGFLFENFDINRIFARVFDWNQSSIKVLEKNGFFLEGRLKNHVYKDGLFTDELIFGLLKDRN